MSNGRWRSAPPPSPIPRPQSGLPINGRGRALAPTPAPRYRPSPRTEPRSRANPLAPAPAPQPRRHVDRRGRIPPPSAPRPGPARPVGGGCAGPPDPFPNGRPGGHILCVAEKPSVARDLARLISGGQARSRPGPSRYNPVHEFTAVLALPGDPGPPSPRPVQFTSVLGHLMQLDFAAPYDRSWSLYPPSDLFDCALTVRVIDGQEPVRDNIAACAQSASALILWLDCDREGENIAVEVADVCRRAARSHLRVYRARFSAIIEGEVGRALSNLGPINTHLSDAVDARQEIDLRIGSAFTRLQTLSWSKRFADMPKVLSYGPCQFPTLGFVVERHLEIDAFVPQSYWNLSMVIATDSGGSTSLMWARGPLYDRSATLVLYSLCLAASQAVVQSVQCSRVSRPAPVPLATVPLQTAASHYLHMGSSTCMDVAENLYRRGLISYPRTETDSFSDEFDLNSTLTDQAQSPLWGAHVRHLLAGTVRRPRAGGHDDHAHPPIYPTQFVAPDTLHDDNERRLYEYIARHFVASCSPDAVGDQTRVVVECGGERFHGSGLMIRSRGFLDVFPYERWSDVQLPPLQRGQRCVPSAITMTSGRTAPPPYLSEADLISLMDRNGIGTDATIAQHIDTIQKRHYAVKRPDRRFVPTPLGVALVVAYDSLGFDLSKPRLRAAMESDMKRIALGQVRKSDVVRHQLQTMANVFASVNGKRALISAALGRYMRPVAPS